MNETIGSFSVKLYTYSFISDNYVIPKSTSIGAPIMLVHQNPAVWSDPLKFDPDCFLPENLKQIHPYALHPVQRCTKKLHGTEIRCNGRKNYISSNT